MPKGSFHLKFLPGPPPLPYLASSPSRLPPSFWKSRCKRQGLCPGVTSWWPGESVCCLGVQGWEPTLLLIGPHRQKQPGGRRVLPALGPAETEAREEGLGLGCGSCRPEPVASAFTSPVATAGREWPGTLKPPFLRAEPAGSSWAMCGLGCGGAAKKLNEPRHRGPGTSKGVLLARAYGPG